MVSATEIRNSPVFIRKENNNHKNKWLEVEREYSNLVTDYKWIIIVHRMNTEGSHINAKNRKVRKQTEHN